MSPIETSDGLSGGKKLNSLLQEVFETNIKDKAKIDNVFFNFFTTIPFKGFIKILCKVKTYIN